MKQYSEEREATVIAKIMQTRNILRRARPYVPGHTVSRGSRGQQPGVLDF